MKRRTIKKWRHREAQEYRMIERRKTGRHDWCSRTVFFFMLSARFHERHAKANIGPFETTAGLP